MGIGVAPPIGYQGVGLTKRTTLSTGSGSVSLVCDQWRLEANSMVTCMQGSS